TVLRDNSCPLNKKGTSTMNLDHELAALSRLTVTELRCRYAQVFGEATRVGNRVWLIKRIAWRLQALAEGDLSQRARRRAAELANDADLRLLPPKNNLVPAGERLPALPAPDNRGRGQGGNATTHAHLASAPLSVPFLGSPPVMLSLSTMNQFRAVPIMLPVRVSIDVSAWTVGLIISPLTTTGALVKRIGLPFTTFLGMALALFVNVVKSLKRS